MLKVHNKDPVKQTKQYMFMVVNLPRRLLNVLSTLNPVSRSVLNVMLEWFEINPKDSRKMSNEFFLDHAPIPSSNIYLFKFNSRITRKRCEIRSKLIKTPERLQLTSFWCFYCKRFSFFLFSSVLFLLIWTSKCLQENYLYSLHTCFYCCARTTLPWLICCCFFFGGSICRDQGYY